MPAEFDVSRFDHEGQGILSRSEALARRLNHREVSNEHLLVTMLEDANSTASKVLKKLGIPVSTIGPKMVDELELKAKSYTSNARPIVGKDVAHALTDALRRNPNADLIEIFAAIADSPHGYAGLQLRRAGATPEKIRSTRGAVGAAPRRPSGSTLNDSRDIQNTSKNQRPSSDPYDDFQPPELLSKFGRDMTIIDQDEQASHIIGRDDEIRRMIQVLSRLNKNNPVLVGPPGVGKSAIVEALAMRMAKQDVPVGLKGKRIFSLDMGSLVAGTSLRGQFEERVKMIVNEIVASKGRIILYIDEIHQLVGAGGGDGPMNAASLIKPALARGKISIIGTTTVDEYREYIEQDAALERRFQRLIIEEPSVEECVSILRGIKNRFEIHHKVQIADSALVAAAKLTDRYIPDRSLPDKAIDAIDEAASSIRLEIDSKPTELDEVERRIYNIEIELEALAGETYSAAVESRAKLTAELERLFKSRDELQEQWETEKNAIDSISAKNAELEATLEKIEEFKQQGQLARAAELKYSVIPKLEEEIHDAQSSIQHEKNPILKTRVEEDDIGKTIANWTGIPVDKMLESEREKLLQMPQRLRRRVVGQDHAIDLICSAIWRSRAGLQSKNRPIGNFMFVGPTGVGKTELAKALSQFLFDSEDALIRIDMSEYMEQSKVNTLIGSARGYVGSEQGGILTEAVRLKPYSVVLFDEAEKAHPDVFNILLQVMDEGRLSDSQGRKVDFSNTLVILTSNVGARRILNLAGTADDEELTEEVKAILKDHFRPEFLNRLDAPVVFQALSKESIRAIVAILEKGLKKMLAEQKMTIDFDDSAVNFLVEHGFEPEYGARPLKRAVQTYVQDPLSIEILENKFAPGDHITVTHKEGEVLSFIKDGNE